MDTTGSPDERLVDETIRSLERRPCVLPLRCQARHYAWGGHDYIPALLGLDHPQPQPYAELWIGAHPMAPASVVLAGRTAPLDRLLARAADRLLGPEVAARFASTLPYLLKVLDVRAMLSIQAHPDHAQAAMGFRRENAAGIPLAAGHRNYKDDNHKPEASVALTDFWMLHGFKPLAAIADTLDAVPELQQLIPDFRRRLASAGLKSADRGELLRTVYEHVMTAAQLDIDRALDSLLARLARKQTHGALPKDSPDFWAIRAAEQSPLPGGHFDRGIVSIYLLNLVRLEPGQGVFVPPGLLHAYLDGTAIEVMASSDNVLRGGLTRKHVDVAELLSVLSFDSFCPNVLAGDRVSPGERRFGTPAAEFALSRVDLSRGLPYVAPPVWGADVFIVIDGEAEIRANGDRMALDRGAAMLVPNGLAYELHADRPTTIYKASVPHPL